MANMRVYGGCTYFLPTRLPYTPQSRRFWLANRHQPMSNLPGTEAVTRLNALPAADRSRVMRTVSSPTPERKTMNLPSGEMVTPCICGRLAKSSMGWVAADAATPEQSKAVAQATSADRFTSSPFLKLSTWAVRVSNSAWKKEMRDVTGTWPRVGLTRVSAAAASR